MSQASINFNDVELGLEFAPLVKGKINSLVVRIPDVNNILKVTLWDKASQTALKTETLNIAVANKLYTFDIEDITLTKNKTYIISFNTNDATDRLRNNSTDATYSITSGNIRIDGFKRKFSATPIFPTETISYGYAGDLSFNFQQTE